MTQPLDEHYGYLCDRIKLERYEAAIEQVVRPEDVVLDLGCGSGLLGLMALRAGARKVVFVEEASIIEVARRTVVEAGFAERAEFHRSNSYELDLAEPANVVVCDHVGYFGFDYSILGLLADARHRFIAADGIVVPSEILLKVAPVETETRRELVARWRDGSVPEEFAWVSHAAANTKYAADLDADNLLGHTADLATLELGKEADAFLSWTVKTECVRDGTLDGLLGWFDCCLHGNIRMTNSPVAKDRLNRPQAFLPLESPIEVREKEPLIATVMARPADHILAWTVELPDQGKSFSLSTFDGLLLDDTALNCSRPDRIARINRRGHARQVVLSYCDGKRSIAEVEALVKEQHPDLFPSAQAAEQFVRKVLAWDTT